MTKSMNNRKCFQAQKSCNFTYIQFVFVYPLFRFVYESNNETIDFSYWGIFNGSYKVNGYNKDIHDCVQIVGRNYGFANWNGPKGSWHDASCWHEDYYICEM